METLSLTCARQCSTLPVGDWRCNASGLLGEEGEGEESEGKTRSTREGREGDVHMRNGWHVEMLMVLAVVIWVAPARSYAAGEREGLPRMGPARS